MQRELRQLLEYKAARGGDYYYDMSGQGELAAGRRKRKHKKMTPMQKKMAHVRAGKKRRGGDFVDLNDLQPYQGAGHKKARAKAFRNPLETAMRDQYKDEYNDEWVRTTGPEYAAKLRKKAAVLNRALAETALGPLGQAYEDIEKANEIEMSAYLPYSNVAKKYGMKTEPVKAVWGPVANAAAYNTLVNNARNAANRANRVQIPGEQALYANEAAYLLAHADNAARHAEDIRLRNLFNANRRALYGLP